MADLPATVGGGPVGTGVFLIRTGRGPSENELAQAWLCLLFVPLLPIACLELDPVPPERESTIPIHTRSHVPPGAAFLRIAKAAAAALATLAPFALGIWTIGLPWASRPLRSLERGAISLLAEHTSWLGRLGPQAEGRLRAALDAVAGAAGVGVETALVLAGAAIPLLVAMELDERRRRIPLREATGR